MTKRKLLSFIFILVLCISGLNDKSAFADEKAYIIRINKQLNHIYIYEGSNLVKEMPCSSCNPEPVDGIEKAIGSKADWQQLADGSFVRYASIYNGTISISSAPYSAQDSGKLITERYNQLGKQGNDFNVWVNIRDAKWIYEKCGVGTKVILYTDDEEKENDTQPFTIPEKDEKAGWDPYDENDKNPWLQCTPVIEGAEDIVTTINKDISEKLRENVTAHDTLFKDNPQDLTSAIQIMGNIDMTKEGVYDQIYIVRDQIGNEASEVIKVKVQNIKSTYQPKVSAQKEAPTYGDKLKLIIFAGIAVFLIVKFVFNRE